MINAVRYDFVLHSICDLKAYEIISKFELYLILPHIKTLFNRMRRRDEID